MLATDESGYRKGVRFLSFGFLGVFGGFQAAQGLQTSLNAELGELNLACLYGTFSILCLIAPPVLSHLERIMGMQLLLLVCSSAYVAMALSNLLQVPAEPSALWSVPVTFNILVGVAAPLLWTAQNTYVGRSAVAAAKLLQEPTEKWTASYNSLFFSIYQFAGMFGNILASIILLSLGEVAWARNVLFVTLGVLALLGAFIFLAMPTVEGANDKQSGLLDTSRLAFTDAKVGLMIPLMLTNGMTLAFFFGDFQTDITCPVAGSGFTGFVIATFFGVNAVASASWGRLISTRTLSRRVVFFLAALLVALFLFLKTTWQAPSNYQLPAGSKDWIKIAEPRALEIAYVFVLSGIFAIGDSFFECGPPMTLQSFYAGSSSLVPAMANYKLWQSLGFAIQFFIAIPLKRHPELRGAVLLCLTVISWLCILLLDRCVCRVDDQRIQMGDEGVPENAT